MGGFLPITFGLSAAYLLVVLTGLLATMYLLGLYRRIDGPASEARLGSKTDRSRREWAERFEFLPPTSAVFPTATGFGQCPESVSGVDADPVGFIRDKGVRVFQEFRVDRLFPWVRSRVLSVTAPREAATDSSVVADADRIDRRCLAEPSHGHCQTSFPRGCDLRRSAVGVSNLGHGWLVLVVLLGGLAIVVPILCLLTFMFIPIGQLVGWYLDRAGNVVFGYTVNIVSSLTGILLYTFLCFLYQPPRVWFLVAGVMVIFLLWRLPSLRWIVAGAFVVVATLSSLGPGKNSSVYRSPYQKIDGDSSFRG
jgi:hypothetical protein